MSTMTTVITNKGLALQNKQINGADLTITKAVSGSGSVPIVDLRTQTSVSSIKQTLAIESMVQDNANHKYTLSILLDNTKLSTAYNLMQIGIYATDPDEGEILFAIGQLSTAKLISTGAELPGYTLQVNFVFQNSNDANIVVNYDSTSLVTRQGVTEMLNAQDYTVEMTSETYVDIEDRIASKKYYNITDTINVSNGTSTVSNMMLI